MTGERLFPMLDGPPIPWSFAEVLYVGYIAKHGHGQDMERIAQRGGFGYAEVPEFYNGPGAVAMHRVIDQRKKLGVYR